MPEGFSGNGSRELCVHDRAEPDGVPLHPGALTLGYFGFSCGEREGCEAIVFRRWAIAAVPPMIVCDSSAASRMPMMLAYPCSAYSASWQPLRPACK
jgi:hypothetical protein